MQLIWLALLAVILSALKKTTGEIIPYRNHKVYSQRPEYLEIPKYAKGDVPHWSPGHGHSYIDLSELRLTASCLELGVTNAALCSNSTFQLLMFDEPNDKYWLDYWPEHNFCCTGEMVEVGSCTSEQEGLLLVPSNLPNAFMRTISLEPDVTTRLHDDGAVSHHEITESGIYILLMANCDENAAPIIIDGTIDSLDPYGFLPADLFGNLPFYGALSCMYSLVGISWLILCGCYR